MPPHWHRLILQGLHSFIEVSKAGASMYFGHISSFLLLFFCTFYMLSDGSLVICHWASWCPGHLHLQRFDCNNKLVRSISLKVFYSFTNITLPLLHIFWEYSSHSLMLLLGYIPDVFIRIHIFSKIRGFLRPKSDLISLQKGCFSCTKEPIKFLWGFDWRQNSFKTRICFFYKNIDVSPLFGVILYCTFSEILTNEIPTEITQKV